MRKGYWRTLIRQIRGKVAIGENAFIFPDNVITIASVEADADIDLEQSREVLLARDGQGNPLILDAANSTVLLVQSDGRKYAIANDLMTFINGLCSQPQLQPEASIHTSLVLGDAIEELPDFSKHRRSIFDDQ